MTNFSTHPAELLILLSIIAFTMIACLVLIHIVKRRRLTQRHAIDRIMSGYISLDDILRLQQNGNNRRRGPN